MTKSVAAYRLSVEKLFANHPKIYLWTLTFTVAQTDWIAAQRFRSFLNHLRQVVGRTGWGGLRVVELHKEHGAHYHLLVTERLAVDLVRRIGRCYCIGRIDVERCWSIDGGLYLSKYLSKSRKGPLTKTGRQARRWGKFGDIQHTRVSDVVYDSPEWAYRRKERLPWLGWPQEMAMRGLWDAGEAAFKSGWFAMKNGRTQDMQGLRDGRLEPRELGEIVECWKDPGPF